MREFMLIFHLLGLTMGVGTSIAFMFLGIAGARLEGQERMKFTLNTLALSRMGHIGLTVLVITGLYLMTPYWKTLADRPLLIAKLTLVLVLLVTISIIGVYSRKARKGEPESNLKKIALLGRISLLCGLAIITLAVLVFR
jgi:uncharacterized membrane protein